MWLKVRNIVVEIFVRINFFLYVFLIRRYFLKRNNVKKL